MAPPVRFPAPLLSLRRKAAGVLLLAPCLVALIPVSAPAQQVDRPDTLLVLQERVGHQGRELVGVFGAEPVPNDPGAWRVRIWQEISDRVMVSTDVVRCDPKAPMRMTGKTGPMGRRLVLRELNPGGAITPLNRLDHLIWWATCQPEQAGKDPATLAPLARQLGYSGALQEREQVLPAPPR